MAKIYLGDYGTVFRVSTGADLTDATDTIFKVKKPDNTEVEWEADVYGDAANGVLTYTTIEADIDQAGTYYLQAQVTFASALFSGDTVAFEVYNEYK